MSYPTKSRQLRTIVVDAIQFRWRFNKGETWCGLIVYGPISGRQPLSVTLPNWREYWTVFPDPAGNRPKAIKSEFVRQAIEFGLANGWQPEKAGGATRLEWDEDVFSVSRSDSQ